jgi:hypothetical protein
VRTVKRGQLWSAIFAALLVGEALSGCRPREDAGAELVPAVVTFGEVGLSPGQFNYPRAMDSAAESLWLVDKAARVQRVEPRTGHGLFEFTMPEQASGKPTGVTVWRPAGAGAVDGGELILVPDTHYHRVMIYKPDGSLLTKFGEYGTELGQFVYPTDIAVLPTPDGLGIARLYVSEYGGNDRISMFEPDASGKYTCVGAFGHNGSSADGKNVQFSRPQSIALDVGRRWLVVTDSCNHRVGVFTLEGTLLRWFGSITPGVNEAGDGRGGLSEPKLTFPYGLALLGDGTALLAEFGGNRVHRVDYVTGESLSVWGHAGRGDGELATPWGVAVIGEMAYVLDSGNNRVMAFPKPAPRTDSDRERASHRSSAGAGASKGGRS